MRMREQGTERRQAKLLPHAHTHATYVCYLIRSRALNEDKLSCRAFPSCVFIRGLIYSASIRQVPCATYLRILMHAY